MFLGTNRDYFNILCFVFGGSGGRAPASRHNASSNAAPLTCSLAQPLTVMLAVLQAGGGAATSSPIGAKVAALEPQQKQLALVAIVVRIVCGFLFTLQETGEINLIPATPLPQVGNIVAIDTPMTWSDASAYCQANYAGLASLALMGETGRLAASGEETGAVE